MARYSFTSLNHDMVGTQVRVGVSHMTTLFIVQIDKHRDMPFRTIDGGLADEIGSRKLR